MGGGVGHSVQYPPESHATQREDEEDEDVVDINKLHVDGQDMSWDAEDEPGVHDITGDDDPQDSEGHGSLIESEGTSSDEMEGSESELGNPGYDSA
jgi:hypothetical protein